MLNVKNVFDGTELANCLKEIVRTKETTTIIFHEDLFGFCDDEIEIVVTYSGDRYFVSTDDSTRSFTSDWTFKDYVYAVCGW